MTIDTDDVLTPAEVAAEHGVTRQMVYQWMTHGLLARGGRRVKLGAVRFAGRVVVRRPALDAFAAAVGKAPAAKPPKRARVPPPRPRGMTQTKGSRSPTGGNGSSRDRGKTLGAIKRPQPC